MNTNDVQVISQIATAHGWNLSGAQITALLAIGAAFIRWARLEFTLAVKTWRNVGGWAGMRQFVSTGRPLPEVKAECQYCATNENLNVICKSCLTATMKPLAPTPSVVNNSEIPNSSKP